MKRLTSLVLPVVLWSAHPAFALGVPDPGLNVHVTNPTLPVTASQSGTWNVGITGTPTVKISGGVSVDSGHTLGQYYVNFASKSDVIFTVPTGKRFVITDIIGSVSSATAIAPPRLSLLDECIDNVDTRVIAGWYMQDMSSNGFHFTTSEHFTSGITLEAGDCLRASLGGDNSSVLIAGYEEDVN
jgi:hypothetical protein